MVIFRSEMKLPQFFVLFVDHKLRIGDEAESDGCSLRALGGPFLAHKHEGAVFPCFYFRDEWRRSSRGLQKAPGALIFSCPGRWLAAIVSLIKNI